MNLSAKFRSLEPTERARVMELRPSAIAPGCETGCACPSLLPADGIVT